MVPVACFDRIADFVDRLGQGSLLKLLNPSADVGIFIQSAVVLGTRILGVFLGQGGEILALVQSGLDVFG